MAHLIDLYPWGRFYHRLGTTCWRWRRTPRSRSTRGRAGKQGAIPPPAWPRNPGGGRGRRLLAGVGDWHVFDFDHCVTFDAVAALLAGLGLPPAYPWVVRSGSGHGWHVWVRCPAPLPAGALPSRKRTRGLRRARPASTTWSCAERTATPWRRRRCTPPAAATASCTADRPRCRRGCPRAGGRRVPRRHPHARQDSSFRPHRAAARPATPVRRPLPRALSSSMCWGSRGSTGRGR